MGDAADDAERRAQEEVAEEGAVVTVPHGHEIDVRPTLSTVMSVDQLVERQKLIETAMTSAMKQDVDYGVIPGVKKPSLFKPGAEKLCLLLMLAPTFPNDRRVVLHGTDGHLDVESCCVLVHTPTGTVVAEGHAYCSTRESRYAFRQGARTCPECGNTTIRKGKTRGNEPRDQYYCWRKLDGCGATFEIGTPEYDAIDKTDVTRVPNPDLADLYNTVVKMADKRAAVAAVLYGTAASSIFTQDVEETGGGGGSTYDAGEYGGADERTPDERVTQPETAPKVGRSWAKLFDEFGKLLPAHDVAAWIDEAIQLRFGVAETAALTREQKDDAFRRAYSTFVLLYERPGGGDLALVPNLREVVADAFAQRWEGIALHGPQWRICPSDPETLPTHEEYVAADERQVADERAAKERGDDVPFGD